MDPHNKRLIDEALQVSGLASKLAPTREQEIGRKLQEIDREIAAYLSSAIESQGFLTPPMKVKAGEMYRDRLGKYFSQEERDSLLSMFMAFAICERLR